MIPLVGESSPMMSFAIVDFPCPFCPWIRAEKNTMNERNPHSTHECTSTTCNNPRILNHGIDDIRPPCSIVNVTSAKNGVFAFGNLYSTLSKCTKSPKVLNFSGSGKPILTRGSACSMVISARLERWYPAISRLSLNRVPLALVSAPQRSSSLCSEDKEDMKCAAVSLSKKTDFF